MRRWVQQERSIAENEGNFKNKVDFPTLAKRGLGWGTRGCLQKPQSWNGANSDGIRTKASADSVCFG